VGGNRPWTQPLAGFGQEDAMTAHPPPVPAEQRAPHEKDGHADAAHEAGKPHDQAPSGNVSQNTTNKGHQQDR
jgi:hypothetical protein